MDGKEVPFKLYKKVSNYLLVFLRNVETYFTIWNTNIIMVYCTELYYDIMYSMVHIPLSLVVTLSHDSPTFALVLLFSKHWLVY